MKRLNSWIEYFEGFVDRWWYGPTLSVCAGLDHYVGVFPILGMMVSSIFLAPKKWLRLALWTVLGSWLGAWFLGWLTQSFGLSFVQNHFSNLLEADLWNWMQSFFSLHGVWLLFLAALAPIPQQPAVILVSLAGAPLLQIGWILLLAKILKFSFIGYLASHAPSRLARFREVRGELEELHVQTPASDRKS
ncbi:MAG: hypothetical protein ACAH59_10345 [Pseudobdellovibrionaceae bacterium]